MAMNILDIDLDFFLDRSVFWRDDNPSHRPDEEGIVPWASDDVVDFVENSLQIGRGNGGAVVQSHSEVFYEWKNLIGTQSLTVPFKVVHVDAHSDLGLGGLSWPYLHSEFLAMDVSERPNAKQGDYGVNFGSFLAFAIGCRWISEIDFIINSNWHDDLPRDLLSRPSYDLVSEMSPMGILPYGNYELDLELMQIQDPDENDLIKRRKEVGEPSVPLNIVPVENIGARYSKMTWDYVFLCHSPGYVPSYADHLLETIGSYIRSES